GPIVVRLRRVIRRLAVVRIAAPLEQYGGHARMVRHTGCAIQCGFALAVPPNPARIWVGTGIEQQGRRADESVRPGWIEPEITGKAKVEQRIPLIGLALRGRGAAIRLEQPADRGIITESRRRVDTHAREVRLTRADRFSFIQRPGSMTSVPRRARRDEELGDER